MVKARSVAVRSAMVVTVGALAGFGFAAALVVAAPTATAAPLLTAAGDIACAPSHRFFNDGKGRNGQCRQLATSRLLGGSDTVLALGDNQYDHGSLRKFRRSYDRSWGRYLSITRPVIGNHEYGPPKDPNRGAGGYWDYFGEERAGPRGRGWYSFDLGAWHIVALNSQCRGSSKPKTMQPKVGCGRGSRQVRWLRRDLAATGRKQCILAAWHHPRFSSGGVNSEVRPFWRALQRERADVVLSGHDHVYERFARQGPNGARTRRGMRQFVVGTGGRSIGRFKAIQPNSEKRVRAFGALRLRLRTGSYRWKFARVGNQRSLDAGTTSCG